MREILLIEIGFAHVGISKEFFLHHFSPSFLVQKCYGPICHILCVKENYHCAVQCNAVLLLQFFFSSSVVFLLVINYELPKQVMRGRLKEKWLFSRLFWFLCLLNHVWEGEVSNRWNEPPYHLLRHQREPPCAEPTMFCSYLDCPSRHTA